MAIGVNNVLSVIELDGRLVGWTATDCTGVQFGPARPGSVCQLGYALDAFGYAFGVGRFGLMCGIRLDNNGWYDALVY